MKVLKLYGILLFLLTLLVNCSREEDSELYQVYYQATTDSMAFEYFPKRIDSAFKVTDTIRFSYEKEGNQELAWNITLSQPNGATKLLQFQTASLLPNEHYWVFNTNSDVSTARFNSRTDITISVDADISFTAGDIKVIKK